MVRLFVSTGEVSGDLQGSLLVKALFAEAEKRSINLEVFALGGPRMQAAGAQLVADTSSLGAIGLWEALPFVLPTLRVQSLVDELIKENTPDAVILIDYMGPNIRLGNKLKNDLPEIPINYYIAPQEWAWRVGNGGSTDLISFSDRILAIFPEEADFYSKRGGKVTWIGHPMLDTTISLPEKNVAREKLGLKKEDRLLLLLPASRKQELRYLMPDLAKAAATLQNFDQSLQVLVLAGQESFERPLKLCLEKAGVKAGRVLNAKDSDMLKPFLFAAADLALGKSGTVNMELALQGVPQVVGYKVSRITAFIAKQILGFRVDHISPVNLLLNERLVPELVQEDFNSDNIVSLAKELLEEPVSVFEMKEGYKRLRKKLGEPRVTERAAELIFDSIKVK
ncbi:lipid-A-disaccharide synthase [Prochlorococcus sp. MIT 1341]|uniref:lipid-A-disaccharide synthase n=1 Tax=Prochlorococcus sp. MIT 1341 TaxID=3096221 RepID=UPI002A74C552|nr:lipid-A-disaccharide synthase [Prochlorococcus sp. MIT 1341]